MNNHFFLIFFFVKAYLNAKARSLYCPDHIHQGSISAGPTEAQCAVCRSPSNVANQVRDSLTCSFYAR